MAVTDDEDRILLGRQVHWPEGRFSTLAGFVEPGESIEQSVRREVFEEAGITVGEVEYVASQPWPFPSSLMLGFMARATSTEINVDGEEIHEARWFSREELRAAFESGEVLPPYGISIAARLIELWYGKPLPPRGARLTGAGQVRGSVLEPQRPLTTPRCSPPYRTAVARLWTPAAATACSPASSRHGRRPSRARTAHRR